jgi:hypothetical protein
MPYIIKEYRDQLGGYDPRWPSTPGELNYVLTRALQDYEMCKDRSYQTFNDMVGALECCKLELYRRLVVPYENKKIKENGDVY